MLRMPFEGVAPEDTGIAPAGASSAGTRSACSPRMRMGA